MDGDKLESASGSRHTGSNETYLSGKENILLVNKRSQKYPGASVLPPGFTNEWASVPDSTSLSEVCVQPYSSTVLEPSNRKQHHHSIDFEENKAPLWVEPTKSHLVSRNHKIHSARSPTFDQPHINPDTLSSRESESEQYPKLEDKEFEDLVSLMGLGGWHDWENDDEQTQLRRGLWRELLGLDEDWNDTNVQNDLSEGPPAEPLYPQGELVQTECYVCFEIAMLHRRICCDFPVCDRCLESYLITQVSHANVKIECLNPKCTSYIQRSEISARLPSKLKIKFYKFLIDANIDPTVKTCPRCSNGLQVEKSTLKKHKVMKNGLLVTCQRCALQWCFSCHAPWHKGLTCKQYRKGDALLKDWARELHYGQLNAQKCPKCKIFIQRTLGCDHMTCSRCDTSFCYRCGESYSGIRLLGNHFSRYSPFGCRYNFMPDSPHMRRFIRGAVLGGKLMGMLALSGFGVAAGAVLLGVGIFVLPVWGGLKLHKRQKYRQRLKARHKYTKEKYAQRIQQLNRPQECGNEATTSAAIETFNSVTADNDESSIENQVSVAVGLQLPNKQCVEVMVHGNFGSSRTGGACELWDIGDKEDGKRGTLAHESTTIVTEIHEVKNASGYSTVVANISAKVLELENSTDVADIANDFLPKNKNSTRTSIENAEEKTSASKASDIDQMKRESEGFLLTLPDDLLQTDAKQTSFVQSDIDTITVAQNSSEHDKANMEKHKIIDVTVGGVISGNMDLCKTTRAALGQDRCCCDQIREKPMVDNSCLLCQVAALKLDAALATAVAAEPINGPLSGSVKPEAVVSDRSFHVADVAWKADKKITYQHDCEVSEQETGCNGEKVHEKVNLHIDRQLENITEKLMDHFSATRHSDRADLQDVSQDSGKGCFGGIFSKKISVNIHIPCRQNTISHSEMGKPGFASLLRPNTIRDKALSKHPKFQTAGDKIGSAGFEKTHTLEQEVVLWIKNDPNCDYASLEKLKDKTHGDTRKSEGILLQDCIKLDSPGMSFSDTSGWEHGDSLSLASTASLGLEGNAGQADGEFIMGLEPVESPVKNGVDDKSRLSIRDGFEGLDSSCDVVAYV